MYMGTIESLYSGLGDNKAENAQIFETIIEEKHQNPELTGIGQSLYRDVKAWCSNYVGSKQEKDYGYDVYEHSRITEKIDDEYLSARQKLALVNYVKYVLSQYNDNGAWLDDECIDYKLEVLKKENFIKYLILLSSSNKRRCLITIAIFFLVELIVLLPAPFDWMELFDLQKEIYSDCSWLNYIVNVLAVKIDWIEGPKLVCLNWRGVVLCGLWMLVYIVFIVNILFNNIFSDISVYDE